jgi:predicted RND superfamily exporter protein
MLLVLIATALIIGITVLYLRSVSIALIIIVGAALSIGVSFFIYRAVYRIPIFPFMNLMSAFILIGIGCDDIFVFFDTWDQEKAEWLRKHQDRQQIGIKNDSLKRKKNIFVLFRCNYPIK